MSPKFVIFDCDGVLIDSEFLANRVEAELKTELGFPISFEEQIRKFVGLGHSHPDSIAELKRLPSNFSDLVDERVLILYKKELKTIRGTFEVMESLKLPKCVASMSEPDWLDMKLEMTNLKSYFPDAVFHGRNVTKAKPEPDLFLFAMKQMGWKAEEGLVIEDSVHGVRAGRAAGLTVCGFIGGAHNLPGQEQVLKQAGAHFVVSDLREIDFGQDLSAMREMQK
jgi:HAD superfamily hydrolase (TIGR01509 family)